MLYSQLVFVNAEELLCKRPFKPLDAVSDAGADSVTAPTKVCSAV